MRVSSALCGLDGPCLGYLMHGSCQLIDRLCQLMLVPCQLMLVLCELRHGICEPGRGLSERRQLIPCQLLPVLCQLKLVVGQLRQKPWQLRQLGLLNGGSVRDVR